MSTLNKEQAIALLSVLEEIDGEKIDGIESAEEDKSGDIVGVYWKQEGTKKYRYAYKLGDASAKTSAIDAEGIAAFLEQASEVNQSGVTVTFSEDGVIEFASASGVKKARNCNPAKSLPCGGSCQPLKNKKTGKDTVCSKPLSADGKAKAKKVKASLSGSDGEAIAKTETKPKAKPQVKTEAKPETPKDEPTKTVTPDLDVTPVNDQLGQMAVEGMVGDRKVLGSVQSPNYSAFSSLSSDNAVIAELDSKIGGLIPNLNHVVEIQDVEAESGSLSPAEKTDFVKRMIAQSSKEGDLVLVPSSLLEGKDNQLAGSLTRVSVEGVFGDTSYYVGTIKDGRTTPLPKDYEARAEQGREALSLRRDQFRAVTSEFSGDKVSPKQLKKIYEKEDEVAEELGKIEDEWMGRKPKKGAVKTVDDYTQKAGEWAKSMGLDDSANGFTPEATKAHDIGHPITHEMIGMDSKAINEALGGLKQKDGKMSLIAEEAIVNIVEHLSRGDELEASILNSVRLARVLSRNDEYETDEARKYVRTKEFKDKVIELADKLYKNDNFTEYMKVVRQHNRISKTVTVAGDDFTNSASGG